MHILAFLLYVILLIKVSFQELLTSPKPMRNKNSKLGFHQGVLPNDRTRHLRSVNFIRVAKLKSYH